MRPFKDLFRLVKKDSPKSTVGFKAKLFANVIRRNGDIEKLGLVSEKMVTTAFVNYLVDSLQNSTTSPMDVFKYHDAGTGVGDELVGNTTLGTPWGGARVTGTQVEGTSANIFKSVGTITFNNTFAITEHGIFSAAADGTLMDRSKFAAINVVNGDSIQFTFELTCTAGG
jgi:hypothetical protein